MNENIIKILKNYPSLHVDEEKSKVIISKI